MRSLILLIILSIEDEFILIKKIEIRTSITEIAKVNITAKFLSELMC